MILQAATFRKQSMVHGVFDFLEIIEFIWIYGIWWGLLLDQKWDFNWDFDELPWSKLTSVVENQWVSNRNQTMIYKKMMDFEHLNVSRLSGNIVILCR